MAADSTARTRWRESRWDSLGNVYGDTYLGGAFGSGVIFQLVPDGQGQWTENLLYQFSGVGGGVPESTLVFDQQGNLYGTASGDTVYESGTVFELARSGSNWVFSILHQFMDKGEGGGGYLPSAGVIFDHQGNLYGTTEGGGQFRDGTVYELIQSGQNWTEKVLHSFHGGDGALPNDSVILDPAGNLYGTTTDGGNNGCGVGCGTLFKLTAEQNGQWAETVFRFPGNGSDGLLPGFNDPLAFDSKGNIYGTTTGGGRYSGGVVFEITK